MNREFKRLQRLRPSRRTGVTMIAFAIPLVLGWYAGVDMLARGPDQAWYAYHATALATIVWTCPIWPKEARNG